MLTQGCFAPIPLNNRLQRPVSCPRVCGSMSCKNRTIVLASSAYLLKAVQTGLQFCQEGPATRMLCREGRVALLASLAFAFITVYYLSSFDLYLSAHLDWKYPTFGFASACLLTFVVPHPDVARNAALIGTVFGCGYVIGSTNTTWNIFGWYMVALATFHLSEYLLTALYNYPSLSIDSFILNHSRQYHIAVGASVVEFCVENVLIPQIKSSTVSRMISFVGLLMVISGECFRKLAMITAKSNFSHIVQYQKVTGHRLVKHGVYSISRHPSYFGWFYWSVG